VSLNLPLSTARLPVQGGEAVNCGVGLGIAGLVAMIVGGILGAPLTIKEYSDTLLIFLLKAARPEK
jgi:hypothetical protein